MFGNVVRGIDGDEYEDAIKAVKATRGVKQDTELDVADAQGADLDLQADLPRADR